MWIVLALCGVALIAVVGVIIGLGSFLPWIIIPLCFGVLLLWWLGPWAKWGLRTYTQENKEFDEEHNIK